MKSECEEAIRNVVERQGRLVVLTGAGISAESGIPTFRGPEGYWTVGAREYRPEEMATFAMFSSEPREVWQWYLYRLGVCMKAEPNAGHEAVVEMERIFGDRFLLITQNVDGLHLRAGNSPDRTFQIHGNISWMRCSVDCTGEVFALPDMVRPKAKDELLTGAEESALTCPRCGSRSRPHVLWFDECYDEAHYRFNSSLEAAVNADMLLIVGTSGATNLPMQVGSAAAQRGALLIDVNPEPNPFSAMAERSGGFFCQGGAGAILSEMVAILRG